MKKEQIEKLRQSIINALYAHTEMGNMAIYEVANDILRKNGLL